MARISTTIGAHKTRLILREGDSFSFTFTLKVDGSSVDFTACTAVLQIRERFAHEESGRPPLLELTETDGITMTSNGIVTIQLTPAQTQQIADQVPYARVRFALRVTDPLSNLVVTILRGEMRLDRSVIR
jgi:hypothetical protein